MADRSSGDLGRKLREARERQGTTLRQVSDATKISVRVLESLERNDISRLPGGIFSRAFVRAYAAQVGLAPDDTVQEFIAQFPDDSVTAGHPTAKPTEDHQAVESSRHAATTSLRLIAVSVPIAGLVLYFATSGRRIIPRPAGEARPAVASPSLPAREPAAASQAPAGPEVPAVVALRLTVIVSVSRACWISARADGAMVIERTFQPGERETIDVRQELVLTAGDAAAVTMTLNGVEARPLGKAGEIVTARMSPANFKDYLPTP